MKRLFSLLAVACLMSVGMAQYTMDDRIYDYIDDYKELAMQEMELYGVPASITLAQAIYASQAGTNDLVRECHNHFSIMCHTKEWKGDTYYRPADQNHENCFRKYSTDAESYRDHSLFLSTRSRYVKLFYYPITDYKSWAKGLKEAGFSGNPRYADTLVSIIEKYYLMHYDRKVAQKLGDTTALRVMQKPQPERTTTTTTTTQSSSVATSTPEPSTAPTAVTKPSTPIQPAQQPQQETVPQRSETPAREEAQQVATKADTMEMNGIQVIVEKSDKKTTESQQPQQQAPQQQQKPQAQAQQPTQQQAQPQPQAQPQQTTQPQSQPATQLPEKVNGLNVFVLDPYTVPYKSAYYPFTSRPVYENNKTKFILARAGDTYQKLATALQLTEKNLRLYNDVYDGSEPIEDEVIYLEQKSTKSTVPYHTLQEGDTYRYIAQLYGIQLKILIKRNSANINSYGLGDKICIGCK